MKLKLKINGENKEFDIKGNETLLKVLRDNGYTEVKNGCEEGRCGACTVLLNGEPVNSCKIFAASVDGNEIITAKGLGTVTKPHIIQQSYVDAGAVQCGFCSPGFVISTYALLKKNPDPTDDEIKKALDGNLCRCTGYLKIIDAVKLASKRMRGEE